MDFDYSDKVRDLQLRVQDFMDRVIYPNEELFYQQLEDGGRWCKPAVLEEMKDQAKKGKPYSMARI